MIPALLTIQTALRSLKDANCLLTSLINMLLQRLDSQFCAVFQQMDPKFDPIYTLATFLDPAVLWVLNNDQVEIALNEIKQLISGENVEVYIH